jgi:hypothetical protein
MSRSVAQRGKTHSKHEAHNILHKLSPWNGLEGVLIAAALCMGSGSMDILVNEQRQRQKPALEPAFFEQNPARV